MRAYHWIVAAFFVALCLLAENVRAAKTSTKSKSSSTSTSSTSASSSKGTSSSSKQKSTTDKTSTSSSKSTSSSSNQKTTTAAATSSSKSTSSSSNQKTTTAAADKKLKEVQKKCKSTLSGVFSSDNVGTFCSSVTNSEAVACAKRSGSDKLKLSFDDASTLCKSMFMLILTLYRACT